MPSTAVNHSTSFVDNSSILHFESSDPITVQTQSTNSSNFLADSGAYEGVRDAFPGECPNNKVFVKGAFEKITPSLQFRDGDILRTTGECIASTGKFVYTIPNCTYKQGNKNLQSFAVIEGPDFLYGFAG